MLAARADLEPDRVAIETFGVGTLTFAQWRGAVDTAAGGLLESGLRRGDRVGLLFTSRDWIEYAIAYCAVQRAGGVCVPCPEQAPAADLRYLLDHCGAVGVLHSAQHPAPEVTSWRRTLADLQGPPDRAGSVRLNAGDLAQILYTSGTTGRPKGVAASHRNLVAGAAARGGRRPLAHSEHFLHAFPIGTNAGQTMLVNALDAKPAALTLPHFTPARFARLAEAYRVGSIFVVPAMAIELINSGALTGRDLSAVRLLGSTAAPLPPSVAATLAGLLPRAVIVNYYTSTEAAPAHTAMIFDPKRPDSVGRPIAEGLMIRGTDGEPLPTGEVGDVWLRNRHSRHYFRDEAASQAVFQDGWVRMGDRGRVDGEGFLYLTDRDPDVIKAGAHKVSTLHVEAALFEHPDVLDAAVLGVPHPVLGTAVATAIVARSPLRASDLRAFLLDRLAPYEVPAHVVFVDQLPRNPAGKVVKRHLSPLFTPEGEQAGAAVRRSVHVER
ncbi:class I adenylate-forming enzyme family protein [Phytohabitans houttuyneae]|nr:AMP-binding protein [Phytohabitans houttuyneae]